MSLRLDRDSANARLLGYMEATVNNLEMAVRDGVPAADLRLRVKDAHASCKRYAEELGLDWLKAEDA